MIKGLTVDVGNLKEDDRVALVDLCLVKHEVHRLLVCLPGVPAVEIRDYL